MEVERAGR